MAWIEAAAALSPASFWVPDDLCPSAWTEHAPFAFWLTEALQPRSFVELGTHNGYSFLAICQAIQRLGLGSAAYAIDSWQGDEHAGFYDEAVFRSVQARSARYAAFSTLIRSTFDDALPYFADGSIDLLHIDGRHRYDDVKHDFETWRGKLATEAVVLFHDINVRERGFGAWRFFDELAEAHASFRFLHGHGLGVLAAGDAAPSALAPLFGARLEAADLIRAAYAALGGALTARQSLARRERDAAALRGVMAEQQGLADATLGQVRRILGLETASATDADGRPQAGPAQKPSPDAAPAVPEQPSRPRQKGKPRVTAARRAAPHPP